MVGRRHGDLIRPELEKGPWEEDQEPSRHQGWTQSELAKKSGIAEGTLSKIVNGEIGTTAEHIYRLAEALDTTSSQLIGERKTILLKEGYIPAEMDSELLA